MALLGRLQNYLRLGQTMVWPIQFLGARKKINPRLLSAGQELNPLLIQKSAGMTGEPIKLHMHPSVFGVLFI